MELSYMELREQMCDVCHKMWQLGWVAANDGNLSAKLPDGTFLATPTGISKSFITPEKLVTVCPASSGSGWPLTKWPITLMRLLPAKSS